ncbi:MAG: sulfatase [Opitutales bacterium]
MKRGLSLLALVALLASPLLAQDPAAKTARRPNVLFIAIDDLKPLLGCYGDEVVQTPNLDRLAERGVVFENTYCQQAVCGPSRASLLTGLRPDTTKVYDFHTKMRQVLPDVITLPQHFKENGYVALAFGKIFDGRCSDGWHTQDRRSWDARADWGGGALYAREESYSPRGPARGVSTEAADVVDEVYKDGAIAHVANTAMRKLADGDQPFFLAVGFTKPHLPFAAPQRYWDLYERADFDLAAFQQQAPGSPDFAYHNFGELRNGYTDIPKEGPLSEEKQLELIHGYHAAVSFVDAQVGKVLQTLDELGLRDDTIIVVWGDHGFHLGDHGLWCKHSNFEQAARVPMLFAAPGGTLAGYRAQGMTEFVDIFPTLCDLAGLPQPEGLEGISLTPLLRGEKAAWPKRYAVSQYRREDDTLMGHSFRTPRYRYTVWRKWDKGAAEPFGEVVATELYDYQRDPLETRSLSEDPAYADVVREMQAIVADFDARSR